MFDVVFFRLSAIFKTKIGEGASGWLRFHRRDDDTQISSDQQEPLRTKNAGLKDTFMGNKGCEHFVLEQQSIL